MCLISALASCGGEADDVEPDFTELSVYVDESFYGSYPISGTAVSISSDAIRIAETNIRFELIAKDLNPISSCIVAGKQFKKTENLTVSAEVLPAYFEENFQLICEKNQFRNIEIDIFLAAEDPVIDSYIAEFISTSFRDANDNDPADPYSGYRRRNFYSDINRSFSLAEIYRNPEKYSIERGGETHKKIEQHLINTAESYFEPCPGYDLLDPEEARQCRSEERVSNYYVWRSPTDQTNVRLNHAKVEWRAAGGIAGGVKALILENEASSSSENCPTSTEPSELLDETILCRALNVRQLLFDEVWKKWNDADWLSAVGLSRSYNMANTTVPHYIGWTEFIVDLFDSTSHVCKECMTDRNYVSRLDYLLRFFETFGNNNQYVNQLCNLPETGRRCNWEGNDFETSGSTDISHFNTTVHLLTEIDAFDVCSSNGSKCVSLTGLARTLDEITWTPKNEVSSPATGFPKFDVFINGHCRFTLDQQSDPMYEFCLAFWRTEIEPWLPHRRLIGLVSLGKLNRDLMIKMRVSADSNQDGLLEPTLDTQLNTYIVFLYDALKSPLPRQL